MSLRRKTDIIFGKDDLENIFRLEKFPVFMGCMDNMNSQDDLYKDFVIDISRSTGIVQVRNLIDLDILYGSDHSSGTIGKIWHDHHKAFAKFIETKTKPSKVFEIGGLHGILSKYYSDQNEISSWTIVEPNPIPVEGCPAEFIKCFFGNDFELDVEFDAYVHSHTFEHIYNPMEFAKKLSDFIPENKDLYFSIPNIEEMVKRKYTNAINFEHTFLLTRELATYIMECNGFRLIECQDFMADHSIFYHFKKQKSSTEKTVKFNNKYNYHKKMMEDWFSHHTAEAKNLVEIINKNDSNVFLFGAHIFSQTLLNFGLDQGYIDCILDNDTNKHGKRLYGTDLVVKSPEIISDIKKPIIILRAGVYNDEIKEQVLSINPSAVVV